jgi:CIC family chloride channel protein
MVAGTAIALASGLGVVGFYGLIDLSYALFIRWPTSRVHALAGGVYQAALTAAGLWVAWALVRQLGVTDGQNVPDVQLAVAKHGAAIPGRPVVVRTLASAVTLGSGGSAGSEGPVAVLGAALGSALGRLLRFPPRYRKILVGCGAAAGIAGAFNAPFAGAFFALEEVLGSFSVGAFSPVVIASVVGALTVRAFLGRHPAFQLPPLVDAHPVASSLLYPLLGVACGLLSAFYSRLYLAAPAVIARLPGPRWIRPIAGGALVGLVVALSGGLLSGNGHLALPRELFGGAVWYVLIALAVAKCVATAVTLGSGGSGGVFTPTLFIGASLGGGVGSLLARVVPGHIVHPAAWALVGMAGMVAGATRAPLTAIFIVFELTDDYGYIIPLMVVSVVAYATARWLTPHGLYDGWLAQRGEHLAHGADQAIMERVRVADAISGTAEHVSANAPIAELMSLARRTRQNAIPVVDVDGTLVGIIGPHELREAAILHGAAPLLLAEDLAEPIAPLVPSDSLRAALGAMNARSRDALPVVRQAGDRARFVGLLTRADILAAYERELEHAV